MNWTINQTVDLSRGYTPVVWPDALMVSGDVGAHTWRLTVLDNGVPADLSGANITGSFLRADGNTVTVAGSVSGNVAIVTLTNVCYAVEGKMKGTIKMTKSGTVITLVAVIFMVSLFTSGSVIDPGVAYADFQIDASPKGVYANLTALNADTAADVSKIYITLDDGKWCYHNGTAFVAGGVYQAMAIADGAVTNNKIASGVVAYDKTDFVTVGKNLFNAADFTPGYFVDSASGAIYENINYSATHYIPVIGSTVYTQSTDYHLAYYDANKAYISGMTAGGTGNPRTITTPSGAGYVRITMLASKELEFQFEVGASSTPYERFGYVFNPALRVDVPVALPPKLYGTPAVECNMYFDNIVENPDAYNISMAGGVGAIQKERWTYVPIDSVTSTPINFRLFDKTNGSGVSSDNQYVYFESAAAAYGTGKNRKLMFIGDSTTAAGVYTEELLTLFGSDAMDITLKGTLGVAPNLHEGRSGWTAANYCDDASVAGVTNPFYNSGFDFSYYITNNPTIVPDYVFIHLGINDIFTATTDAANDTAISSFLSDLEEMVDSIRLYSTAVKIGIMTTIPPSSSQDAFGRDYAMGQERWRYRRNWFRAISALIHAFSGREAENVYLVPTHVCLDTVNNMHTETVAVNSRNSTTVVRQSNGVHPANSGYYQMADCLYGFLKCQE